MNFRATQSRRAFSLVELALVISIMAVLAGLAAPRYGRALSRYRADATAKRVAADLLQAQQRARAASGACVLTFSVANGSYATTYPTVGGVAGRVVTTNLTTPPYLSTIRSATFGSDTTISFDGYGVPSSGGTVVIGSANETRTITVSSISGAIAVSSP